MTQINITISRYIFDNNSVNILIENSNIFQSVDDISIKLLSSTSRDISKIKVTKFYIQPAIVRAAYQNYRYFTIID